MDELWFLFCTWVEISRDEDIEKDTVFLLVCPDGSGWISDGGGGNHFEFDSIESGKTQLTTKIKEEKST